VAGSWVERVASRLEYRAMTRAEEKYVRLASHVVAVSDRNKEFFTRYVPAEKDHGGLHRSRRGLLSPSPESEIPNQVAFTGSYDWMPNQDAAEWYFQEILPLTSRKCSGLVTWMVGKAPTASMERFAKEDPSFRVTGRVDDVRPFIAQCPVYIVPMRSGSGTRLKIFEAMAAGKAIVSTPTGAEGLPVQHERDILLAETADGFAKEVTRALKDAGLRRRLGAAARTLVEERYSWKKVAEEFEAILQGLRKRIPERVRIPLGGGWWISGSHSRKSTGAAERNTSCPLLLKNVPSARQKHAK
jgi:glycosyltransferase involved in cell wall biosynthesis